MSTTTDPIAVTVDVGPLPSAPARTVIVHIHKTSSNLSAVPRESVFAGASALLPRLRQYERSLFDWMTADPANARLFVTDPMAALSQANVGIPAGLFQQIQAVRNQIAATKGEKK